MPLFTFEYRTTGEKINSTSQMSICPWGFNIFKALRLPRLLGLRRWNLARVFYGCRQQTTRKRNFDFLPHALSGATLLQWT